MKLLHPIELGVALRYIFSRRREKYISIISVLSMGGVALSVAVLLVVIAVMSGFERDLKDKITGLNAHVTVSTDGGILYDWREVMAEVKKIPGVAGASPYVLGQVMMKKDNKIFGAVFKGVDLELEKSVSQLSRYISDKNLTLADHDLIMGTEMPERLGLKTGDDIRLLAPTDILTPLGPAPRIIKCRLVSTFDSGMYQFDSSVVVGSLGLGQKCFSLGAGVHGLELRCLDPEKAFAVKQEILRALSGKKDLSVETWIEKNRNLFAAVRTEKKVMFILLMLAVLVSAGNIISTLVMLVMEKTKDIGILKSIGLSSLGVLRLFFLVGAIIGAVGTLLGTAGGLLFLRHIDRISEAVSYFTGFDVFPKDIYYLDRIPVSLTLPDLTTIVLSALIVSLLSSVYPAWRAANLKIVEALRYE